MRQLYDEYGLDVLYGGANLLQNQLIEGWAPHDLNDHDPPACQED